MLIVQSWEGLLTAAILLVAKFCPPEKQHIISLFKLIQELLTPFRTNDMSRVQMLIDKLPGKHKARWFAGATLKAVASVISTALSQIIYQFGT